MMAAPVSVPDELFQMWLDASKDAVKLRHPGMSDKQVLQVMGYALRDELERPDRSPSRLASRFRVYMSWLRGDGGMGARA
jgi:hypothetical protein